MNEEFDVIITFARGGLVAAQFIAYAKDIQTIIAVNSPKELVPGYHNLMPTQKVLIVDDICDSGATLSEALYRLKKYEMGREWKTAVLFKRYNSSVCPDFVGENLLHDDYIHFTWDKENANA